MGQHVVVAPVLELALGLTASGALGVQELAALPLLSPQPASKQHRPELVPRAGTPLGKQSD